MVVVCGVVNGHSVVSWVLEASRLLVVDFSCSDARVHTMKDCTIGVEMLSDPELTSFEVANHGLTAWEEKSSLTMEFSVDEVANIDLSVASSLGTPAVRTHSHG